MKQLPSRARDVLSVIDYSDTDRISQALGRLDSNHRENSENKYMGQASSKGSAPQYRGSAQQPHQKPMINHIRETPNNNVVIIGEKNIWKTNKIDIYPRTGEIGE